MSISPLIGKSELIDIHPAGESARIAALLVISCRPILIHKCCDFPSKDVIDSQINLCVMWQLVADGCRGIKGIGVVLE